MIEPVAIDSAVIGRAEPTDLDAIMSLEEASFDAASRWSRESWRAELTGTDRWVLVAGRRSSLSTPNLPSQGSRQARPTATGLAGVATFQLVGETADLHRVVVAPENRGRGIGRALVESGLAWAAEHGARRTLLEVEGDNAPALALYRGLGFVELARRKDYYGAGRHALVMQRVAKDDITEMGELA